MRLRNPKKYREEFEKAAAKYLKKVGDYGKNSVLDGRGRMEKAIATQGINTRIVTPEEPLSEPAKALAAAGKANKPSKGTSAEPAASPAKTEQVKMARIGNTNEFGVFPESVGNALQLTR